MTIWLLGLAFLSRLWCVSNEELVYKLNETPYDYYKHKRVEERNIDWKMITTALMEIRDVIPDTVPENITCKKTKYCDSHGVCALVCERGTVEIDPWIINTLAFQRKLMMNMSLCDIQIPGTHNSAITLADGYGVEDHIFNAILRYIPFVGHFYGVHTNDQIFSLTDQLHMGVRFLELDIHWFNNDLRIAHCGGFHSRLLDTLIDSVNKIVKLLHLKIQWDSETIGCKPSLSSIPAEDQRHLSEALEEISKWLHLPENENEFLVIFFDDETDLFHWNKVQYIIKYINKYFDKSEIFLPSTKHVKRERWPTMSELLSQGKHIMFLSGVDLGALAEDLLFVKDKICHWKEPSVLNFTSFPSCRFSESRIPYTPHRIWRPQATEIQYGYLNGDGHIGPNVWPLNEETLPPLIQCGINIPSPDNITPERIKSWIWTWAEGHPLTNVSCTGIPKTGSKWHSVPCDEDYLFACRDLSIGKWYLEKLKNCSGRLVYTYPKTSLQHQHLIYDLKKSAAKGVYINFSAK